MKTTQDLIPFHLEKSQDNELKQECFLLWRNLWKQTFAELQVFKTPNADDFLDRDIYGLRNRHFEVCGFMLIREFKLGLTAVEHSYFHNYPSELKSKMASSGKKIAAISYMTIAPEWRKSQTDIPLSELLMGFCVDHFIRSNCDELYGYFRNNRKTHDIFYRHGGKPLLLNQSIYNVQADIAFMSKNDAQLTTLENIRKENERLINILKGEFHEFERPAELPELSFA